MINETELRELARFQTQTPILSVYLDVDPTRHTSEEYLLSLRGLLKSAAGEAAKEDIEAVQRYFEHEYDWSGRGVALFSCAAADFWRDYVLPIPVPSGVTVARRPYISPLAALLNAYGRYAVAVVNQEGIRIVLYHLGEPAHEETFEGEEVRKIKRGRGSSGLAERRGGAPAGSRHMEEVAMRNLRQSVQVLERFWRQHSPRRLILAGAEPALSQFRDLLPKTLQEALVGTMGVDPDENEADFRDRALEILRAAEEERKAALVEALVTAAAKGKDGVVGLDETLTAVQEGRVRTLVVLRDFHTPGYRCQSCGYLTAVEVTQCPYCGGAVAGVPDVAEAAVTRVIEDGGEVEVLDYHPLLERAGIGALLRY